MNVPKCLCDIGFSHNNWRHNLGCLINIVGIIALVVLIFIALIKFIFFM